MSGGFSPEEEAQLLEFMRNMNTSKYNSRFPKLPPYEAEMTIESMRRVLGGNGPGTPGGLAPYTMFTYDLFVADIVTLLNPNATLSETFEALLFTFFKPAKGFDKLQDVKNVGKGTGKVPTGGRELSVDEYLKRLDEEDDMYESFRKSKTDVNSIAKNTGMTEQRGQRIKEHLLFKEHIKEHGVGRFDSDYEIAQAWDRLQKGTHKKNDIDLLNHELFESKFEGIFKTDYRTVHDKTVESGRPWHPPEEE